MLVVFCKEKSTWSGGFTSARPAGILQSPEGNQSSQRSSADSPDRQYSGISDL
jgi:hypothetical protein